jgi:hypothetical protein
VKPNIWTTATAVCANGNCVEVIALWKKSSRSNGNGGNNCVEVACLPATASGSAGYCVEVGHAKAEKSAAVSQCAEVSRADEHEDGCMCDTVRVNGVLVPGARSGDVLLRDSKDKGDGPVFVYTSKQWVEFCAEVKRQSMGWPIRTVVGGEEFYVVIDPVDLSRKLLFTVNEWAAFVDGVFKGEFIQKAPVVVG